jgi:ComF family protein
MRLKYHDRRTLAADLGALLAQRLEELRADWQPDGIVPVPIHPQRRRERGFNQADLLAAATAERCGLPFRDVLERTRNTPPQVGLPRDVRRQNVHGAFVILAAASPGVRPVLIDDVQTTGATLEAAAQALRAAGARAVYALTVAAESTRRQR